MKTHELKVATGDYRDKDGNLKLRYKSIGYILNKDGKESIFIDRTFNPAGVPNPDNKDSVYVFKFEVKKDVKEASFVSDKLDDEVPF